MAYVLARAGEWSIRVLGTDGAIDVVHTSSSRLSAPSWRPGGGVLDLRRAGLRGDEPAAVAAARRAARVEAADAAARTCSRRAPRGGPAPSSSMRPTGSSGAAASRRRRASPCICSRRPRSKSRRRRRTSRRSTTAASAPGARHQRPRAIGRRPAHGFHGARRPVARGARRAAAADGRRVRRPRPELLARRRLGRVRERAHGPVRAVAARVARRRLDATDVRRTCSRAIPPCGPTATPIAYLESASLEPDAPRPS